MKKSDFQLRDEELLSLLCESNEAAFTEIYKRYWQPLYKAALKRVMAQDLAIDIVQEIFCDLWARRQGLTSPNLGAYLFQSVKFQVYKAARKRKSMEQFYEQFDRLSSTPPADVPLLEREVYDKLQAWLAKLPANKQAIFEMKYEQGKTTSEIAQIMELSKKTVQNHLSLCAIDLKTKIFFPLLAFLMFHLQIVQLACFLIYK